MRRQEVIREYQQTQEARYRYNQPVHQYAQQQQQPEFDYYQNIPVGRPIGSRDNDSSFASDYPEIWSPNLNFY